MQGSFDDYFRDSQQHAELRKVVASELRGGEQDRKFSKVLTHVEDKLREKWSEVEDWRAFARIVAQRKAIKLGLTKKEQKTASVEPEIVSALADASADEAPSPLEEVISGEEKECLKREIAKLSPEERRILEAWMTSKSAREAAEKLGMPESTFRKKFWEIIEKLQRACGMG